MSATSALNNLKEDIKLLEKLFLKKSIQPSSSTGTVSNAHLNVSCFRLISASLDELVCEFIDTSLKKYRINANICVRDMTLFAKKILFFFSEEYNNLIFANIFQETYPQSPPVWFSESEDPCLLEIVEKLSTTTLDDNRVCLLNRVKKS